MGGIHTVFDAIVDNGISGKKVQIPFETREEYETARTRLVTLWTTHRNNIIAIIGDDSDPLLPYSLCADWSNGTGNDLATGTFYLGKPRRKVAKQYSFVILGEDETPKVANDGNS